MVNTGLPSRDCHTCRRRRVKCDLRRPGCHRCEKIGQECTGYRDLENPGLVFRVQTPTSYVGRRKGQRSRERSNVTRDKEDPDAAESHLLRGSDAGLSERSSAKERLRDVERFIRSSAWALSPSPGVVESWDTHITPLIVNQFSLTVPGRARIYASLECIPDLLKDAETDSALYLASHAVGYAYFSQKSQSSGLVISHRSRYGQALHALRLSLHDPILQKQDCTLLAVWLLCFYELVKGDDTEDTEPGPIHWLAHSRALTGLLRLRGREQFQTKTGCQLFQLAYHTIQINSLQTRCEPPPEAGGWFDAIQSSGHAGKFSLIPLFVFCDEAAWISTRARTLAETGHQEEMLPAATFAIRDCNDLESRMREKFGPLVPCSLSDLAARPVVSEDHNVIQALRIRNYIDATFLRLYYSILELLFHAAKFSGNSIDQREEIGTLRQLHILQSQARADRILATLPIFLPNSSNQPGSDMETHRANWADSVRVMWNMRLVASSPVLLERQKMAGQSALSRLAYEAGLMQAVGTYYPSIIPYDFL